MRPAVMALLANAALAGVTALVLLWSASVRGGDWGPEVLLVAIPGAFTVVALVGALFRSPLVFALIFLAQIGLVLPFGLPVLFGIVVFLVGLADDAQGMALGEAGMILVLSAAFIGTMRATWRAARAPSA